MKILLLGILALHSPSAHSEPIAIDCESKIGEAMGDLRKLRKDANEIKEMCHLNAGTPVNESGSSRRRGGDCEQTYGIVRGITNRVEKKLGEICRLVNEGNACRGARQKECQLDAARKHKDAATKYRDAMVMLKNGRRIVEEKKIAENINNSRAYAEFLTMAAAVMRAQKPGGPYDLSELSPKARELTGISDAAEVIRRSEIPMTPDKLDAAASDITGAIGSSSGEGTYGKYADEQIKSLRHGRDFLEKSQALEKKLQVNQAKLNSLAAESAKRAESLGQAHNPKASGGNLSSYSGAGSGLSGVMGSNLSSGGMPNFAYSPPELSEEELEDAIDGKPLPFKTAAFVPGLSETGSEQQSLAADEKLAEKSGKVKETVEESSTTVMSEISIVKEREPASLAEKGALAPASALKSRDAGFEGVEVSGMAASKVAATKERAEAMGEFAAQSNTIKSLERRGPTLRELLRQKLSSNGDNSTTRAMQEVLSEIGESNEAAIAGAGFSAHGSKEEIKGIDSEPLFVRVRAAHLRFQKKDG